MSGAQFGCATQTQTQSQPQPPFADHMFKRPPPYPQPQQPQIPEHLQYHYTVREYGLPLWPLQTTPHEMHPAPPPLPPQIPIDEDINEELNQQDRRRLIRHKLLKKIRLNQIRLLQRKIQKNTTEIQALQSQMKQLEKLMPRPPQKLQPTPPYYQQQQEQEQQQQQGLYQDEQQEQQQQQQQQQQGLYLEEQLAFDFPDLNNENYMY